jgi:hypothetical protein
MSIDRPALSRRQMESATEYTPGPGGARRVDVVRRSHKKKGDSRIVADGRSRVATRIGRVLAFGGDLYSLGFRLQRAAGRSNTLHTTSSCAIYCGRCGSALGRFRLRCYAGGCLELAMWHNTVSEAGSASSAEK